MAINPLNDEEVPVCIANYILSSDGTGAIMGVPAHDERDKEFARLFNLDIKPVVIPENDNENNNDKLFTEKGILVNSYEFTGLASKDAIERIIQKLQMLNVENEETNYRLRDWGISRQPYWGAPIPIIYCNDCVTVPVAERDLPVILLERFEFTDKSDILKNIPEFYNVTCPCYGMVQPSEKPILLTPSFSPLGIPLVLPVPTKQTKYYIIELTIALR